MDIRIRAAWPNRALAATLCTGLVVAALPGLGATVAAHPEQPAEVRLWPCRLIVRSTLLGAIEDGWKRSPTLRRQCEELARARAVVTLEWGKTDAQSLARTRLRWDREGVVVAAVAVPPVSGAVALVAHELEHVLERVRGLDFEEESRRRHSEVWRAFGGFETQGAIDVGRRVERELEERGSG